MFSRFRPEEFVVAAGGRFLGWREEDTFFLDVLVFDSGTAVDRAILRTGNFGFTGDFFFDFSLRDVMGNNSLWIHLPIQANNMLEVDACRLSPTPIFLHL